MSTRDHRCHHALEGVVTGLECAQSQYVYDRKGALGLHHARILQLTFRPCSACRSLWLSRCRHVLESRQRLLLLLVRLLVLLSARRGMYALSRQQFAEPGSASHDNLSDTGSESATSQG